MGVVLLANELGSGLGHITRLMPVARALQDRGHTPVIAVHDVVAAAPALTDPSIPVLQTPQWRGRVHPKTPTRTFACLLADRGFARPDVIGPLLTSWLSLLDTVKPDLIVADHSPTLYVAAHGGTPIVMIGDGFTLPPCDGNVFPPLRTDVPPVQPEEEVLAVVQAAQRDHGIRPFDTLPEIFAQGRRFLVNLPQIDPYRDHRHEPVDGPLQPPPPRRPLPAMGAEGGDFYAYLYAGHPLVGELLGRLAAAGIRGGMFVHEATAEQRDRVRASGFTVYDEPQPLERVLGEARAVIHHGGAGVTAAALSVGRPQVLLPRYLEQRLTGAALHHLGVGVAFDRHSKLDPVIEAIAVALTRPSIAERAQEVAKEVEAGGPYDTLSKIVECCVAVLEGGEAGVEASAG